MALGLGVLVRTLQESFSVLEKVQTGLFLKTSQVTFVTQFSKKGNKSLFHGSFSRELNTASCLDAMGMSVQTPPH